MSFILGEEAALHKKLQGMTVSDQKSENEGIPRGVRVFYGQPDQEITTQNYPYLTIEMIGVTRDTQREMRGLTNAAYLTPEGLDTETMGFLVDTPIPVNLTYQITTYSRQPRHDREIMAQLLGVKLPMRFGTLEVIEKTTTSDTEVVNTSTMRRFDVINVAKRDVTEQAKRLFVNAITVNISSEINQGVYRTLYKVLEVDIHNPTAERALGTAHAPYFTGLGEHTYTA